MVKIYMKGNRIYREVDNLIFGEEPKVEVITAEELVSIYNEEKQRKSRELERLYHEKRIGEAYGQAITDIIKILELSRVGK